MFNHVSTTYVNCNKKPNSQIVEKIYPFSGKDDFEVEVKKIFDADPKELEQKEKKFLNDHYNTYVFSKDLAERYLERHRGKIKLVITRPSII